MSSVWRSSTMQKNMARLKSFLVHAESYGFDPIGILFPDAKDVNGGEPITIQRNTTWVGKVLSKTKHTPFARIRTRIADITADEARAKGYITGNLKKRRDHHADEAHNYTGDHLQEAET